jgi:hypothetical protein
VKKFEYFSLIKSKYVTRVVNLANSSTFLKSMFGAHIPAVTGSDIEVYYKLLPAGSTTDITKFNFVKAGASKGKEAMRKRLKTIFGEPGATTSPEVT